MFCTKCGASVTGKFCGVCGTPIGQAAPPPPPVPPAQPTPPPQAAPQPPQQQPPQQQYGAPQYGAPQYGAPQYGAPQYAAPQQTGPSGPVWDYATWGSRVLGYLIDSLLAGVVMTVLGILAFTVFGSMIGLGSGLGSDSITGLGTTGCCCMLSLFPLSILLIGLWNKVYLVAQRGYSIGQGVMKIKVVNAQGQLLTQGQALIRLLAHVGLSFVWIGGVLDLLWPLWDERRQTLHDKAVGCYVINNPSGR